jgi:predicted transcriptional regulator
LANILAIIGEIVRTFHLPLSDELHDALREEAAAERRPATDVVRDALSRWIQAQRRQRLADEIQRFAVAEAGTALDLDAELEAASVATLIAADGQ